MTVGGAHGEPSTADKQALTSAFADTGYHLTWAADMDAWYKCHLAFILPIVYLSYALDCDLRRATGKQIKTGLQAVREGYGLLDALGYPILPEDTMEKLHGFKGALSYVLLRLMAKTTIGELAATDHCRNAVTELEALDTAFAALRERGLGFPMPHWDTCGAPCRIGKDCTSYTENRRTQEVKYTCCERLMWHIIAPASLRYLSKRGWDAPSLKRKPR